MIKETESKRFLKQVQDLHKLKKGELYKLNIEVKSKFNKKTKKNKTIF